MLKILWCWFPKFFGTFTMFLVKVSSQTGLLRDFYNHVFGVRNFENTKSLRVIFCSKYLKFMIVFKNAAKNWAKVFCFWDNCIWIGIVKLSLLWTGYFSSTGNALTTSTKTWHVKNRDVFSNSNDLAVINLSPKDAVIQISTVARHFYRVPCWRILWNRTL